MSSFEWGQVFGTRCPPSSGVRSSEPGVPSGFRRPDPTDAHSGFRRPDPTDARRPDPTDATLDGESIQSGERVEVVVTIEVKNDYEYLLIEDLKPAGLEAVELVSGTPLYAQKLDAIAFAIAKWLSSSTSSSRGYGKSATRCVLKCRASSMLFPRWGDRCTFRKSGATAMKSGSKSKIGSE